MEEIVQSDILWNAASICLAALAITGEGGFDQVTDFRSLIGAVATNAFKTEMSTLATMNRKFFPPSFAKELCFNGRDS